MEPSWKDLVEIVGTSGGLALLFFLGLMKFFPEQLAKNFFAKELEKAKNEFAKELEHEKFKLSHKAVRLAKVYQKEFEILQELFKKLSAVKLQLDPIISPFGYGVVLSKNDPDIEKKLSGYDLSQEDKAYIKASDSKQDAFYRVTKIRALGGIQPDFIKLREDCLASAPFLSEDIYIKLEQIITKILKTMNSKYLALQVSDHQDHCQYLDKVETIFQEVITDLNELVQMIRSVLRDTPLSSQED